jgi:hypothetical protein
LFSCTLFYNNLSRPALSEDGNTHETHERKSDPKRDGNSRKCKIVHMRGDHELIEREGRKNVVLLRVAQCASHMQPHQAVNVPPRTNIRFSAQEIENFAKEVQGVRDLLSSVVRRAILQNTKYCSVVNSNRRTEPHG